jgi:molybdopterin-guanine dinucleotide biosynthesis protein A
MQKPYVKVSCIILAGGKSSRLRNKPFLLLNKKPLILHVLKVAKKFFRDIVIVVKSDSQKKRVKKIVNKRIKIVKDRSRTYSPIAGIKEGVKHAKHDYLFVLASDMPLIRENTIRELLPRAEEELDCIAYIWKLGKYEPLCAIYKKNIFENSKLRTGLHQLIDSIENKVFVPIAVETNEFFNVNTKKDLEFAKKLLASELR